MAKSIPNQIGEKSPFRTFGLPEVLLCDGVTGQNPLPTIPKIPTRVYQN